MVNKTEGVVAPNPEIKRREEVVMHLKERLVFEHLWLSLLRRARDRERTLRDMKWTAK